MGSAARMEDERGDCGGSRRQLGARREAGLNNLDTIPKLLLQHAKVRPDRPAMREKIFGIWRCWTWREAAGEVAHIAATLSGLGFERGDRLAVIGDNRPLLYWSMIAAQALGGLVVPLYQDGSAGEIADVLARCGVRHAVAENQEQVDKLLEIRQRCPRLERIFYTDPRGLRTYREPDLQQLSQASERGPAERTREVAFLAAEIARGKAGDAAGIYCTSGTSGPPKAVVLSFGNVLAAARAVVAFEGLTDQEEVLAYLPMAWIGDHMVSVGQAYCAGYCVNCPESPATAMADLREIGPTYFFAPPRIWDGIRNTVTLRMEDAGALKRWLYGRCMRRAAAAGGRLRDAERAGAGRWIPRRIGETLVYGPLKNALGMSRVRIAHTSGEAISAATFDFVRALGINLKQIYGSTEGALFVAGQSDGSASAETVGRALPGFDLEIGDGGEILFRGAGAFQEYCQDPGQTAAVKAEGGWIRSGDTGFIDERGELKIVDRAEEASHLADGTLFAPMQIENRFRAAGPIREIVVFGQGRAYVAAFVTIDAARVGNWAERRGLLYTNYRELAERAEVHELVREAIETINAELARDAALAGTQVRRFLILKKEFDPDDGELTRTRKLRRRYVAAKYAALVDLLYAEEMAGEAEAPAQRRDGGVATGRAEFAVLEAKVFRAAQGATAVAGFG